MFLDSFIVNIISKTFLKWNYGTLTDLQTDFLKHYAFYLIYHEYIFLGFYLFILRERGKEREREGEKHQYAVASCTPFTGDLAHNPDMCPWDLNWWPFGSQAGTQSTEPHQPGPMNILICQILFLKPMWAFSRMNIFITWTFYNILTSSLIPLIKYLLQTYCKSSTVASIGVKRQMKQAKVFK